MAAAPTTAPAPASGSDYIQPGHSAWMDVDWSEHQRWMTVDGRRVNLIDAGQGEPVVLIHGLGGSWQNWLENMPHLMESHRVIAIDLPGFGFSEEPREDISISGYAACMDQVFEQLEIDSATVVGNSMGGFVGADMALAFPQRVRRLALVSAAILWNERRRARPLVTLSRVTGAYTAVFMNRWEIAATRPRVREAILSQVVRRPANLSPELAYEIMRRAGSPAAFGEALEALFDYRLRDHLHEIAAPTLVVWGTHDLLVPPHHGREMAQVIPDARLEVFERTGHMPMLERPARFNRVLDEFIAAT
jgi:pimeloyl-ACP methyl ester carboxylesterase